MNARPYSTHTSHLILLLVMPEFLQLLFTSKSKSAQISWHFSNFHSYEAAESNEITFNDGDVVAVALYDFDVSNFLNFLTLMF